MKFRKVIPYIILGGAILFVIDIYERVRNVISFAKALPEYLLNVLGARPIVSATLKYGCLFVELGLPESAMQESEKLHKTIKEYIADYYPKLAKYKVCVKTYLTDY